MTIDEAIEIYEIRANTHEREAEYHRPLGYSHEAIANVVEMQAREERQIAKWLKELKERRAEQTEPLDKDINVRSKTMRDCYNCKRYEAEGECVECHYEPKTEPQTEKCPFDDAIPCEWVNCPNSTDCPYKPKDEPQTERSSE